MKSTTPTDVVNAVLHARHSVRAFLETPVSRQQLHAILDQARFAPSGVNTQPWQVAVLTGQTLKKISQTLLEARAQGLDPNPDYAYYPNRWFEPYQSRRKACGLALYGALQIARDDHAGRIEQWNRNYSFFGAPAAFIVHLDARLEKGSWMDTGMFMQNILLAAQGLGLGTCAQASIAEYPDRIRAVLGLPDTQAIVCGVAIGYPDLTAPVNQYRTSRLEVDTFTQWYE